jgi:effector-binding domain-containing protein
MTDQQHYDVLAQYPGFELRRYPEHVVAETRVKGSFESVGNKAFMRLVRYISGRNRESRRVAMTAPVVQEAERGRYVVSFVMPAAFSLESAPEPTDRDVRLRTVPAQTAAVLRFSGRWSEGRYEAHAERLLEAVDAAGLHLAGPLRFARFDPPWTPWFLRRNEVVVPVLPPES